VPRLSPRRLIWRPVQTWFLAVVGIVGGLMLTTKVRKILRGERQSTFPTVPPRTVPVGRENHATTYTYGEDLYADMLEAIRGAQRRVLFETFILKSDEVGQAFKRELVAAAQRGVDVHVIYDGFANLVVPRRFLRFPPSVHVLRFPVLKTGLQPFNPRRWGRDHRKILVVDDAVGFVGGYNIGALYATQWRDTHLKVEGSAVWDLDNAFIDFWNDLHPVRIAPLGDASWEPTVRAHRNVPRQLVFPIRGMYLEAIDRARHHIHITAAYFIPDHDILQALLEARSRGVEVTIIVPEVSNHVVADWLSRGFYGELLRHGVRIQLYQDAMVHAKTMTIDGHWSTVGTANIDRLSLTGNYEINLEVVDPQLAAHLETVFGTDLENCRELTLEEWQARPFVARACELLLSPLRPLL
jgi:cardiolipin synthase